MKKVIKFISSLLIILLFLLNSSLTTFAVMETDNSTGGTTGTATDDCADYWKFTNQWYSCLDWVQWWDDDYAEDGSWGTLDAGAQLIKHYRDDYVCLDWNNDLVKSYFDWGPSNFWECNETQSSGTFWLEVKHGDVVHNVVTTDEDEVCYGNWHWYRGDGDFGIYHYDDDKYQYVLDENSDVALHYAHISDSAIYEIPQVDTPSTEYRNIPAEENEIKKVSKVTDKDGHIIYNRNSDRVYADGGWKELSNNENFYKYGKDSYDYDGTLHDGDSQKYKITYESVKYHKDGYQKGRDYIHHEKAGEEPWNDSFGDWYDTETPAVTYTITGSGSDTLAMNYKVEVPLTYTIYRPWDLNTMQPADEDYIIDEGGFSDYKKGAQPLEIVVDNFKGITDGTVIPGIDVNNKIPFKIYFKNDSFGIPENIQNKTFNDWEIQNLDYSNSSDYSTYTQKINSDNNTSKNLSVNYTDAYCQGNPTFDITPANNTSITDPDGNETTSKMSFGLGFRGGTFYLKAIKKGTYNLTNGDDGGFISVNYNKKVYTKQGMKYSGTYTVDNRFGEGPSIETLNDKIKLTSTNVSQPVVKGDFIIDTLAGN